MNAHIFDPETQVCICCGEPVAKTLLLPAAAMYDCPTRIGRGIARRAFRPATNATCGEIVRCAS